MRAFTLFFYEAVMHPSRIGALFPSSKKLAYSIAEHIAESPPGVIVELTKKKPSISLLLLSDQLNFLAI